MTDPHRDDLPEMLSAIIQVARSKFPGHDWAAVENHLRRAWNDVSHDAAESWQHIRARVRQEWDAFD
jgi:outer membrane receptor for ferric coprogen and ferric-rhodotorulic acid